MPYGTGRTLNLPELLSVLILPVTILTILMIVRHRSDAMSIRSDSFGRVALSGQDAKKFKNQVVYGRPKKAAKDTVANGLKLSNRLQRRGKLRLRVAIP